VRALVLENQKDTCTYNAFCEYLMGKDILIAPLWSDTTFYRDIYLPEGEWIDFFNDTVYKGKQNINFHAPIDKVPIFIKAGAIIPMAPDNQHYVDEILSPLTIHIYPDGTSTFDLYEDDGESYDYEKGIYTITTFSSWDNGKELLIKKAVPAGNYRISEREHLYCVHQKPEVKKVIQDGRTLPVFISLCDFNSAEEGWIQESEGKKLLWVKIKSGVNDAVELKIVGD
jgi:alpha-glucosidase (family GH31 glycosyl hydrolase)